jgi:hypothetical protein
MLTEQWAAIDERKESKLFKLAKSREREREAASGPIQVRRRMILRGDTFLKN